MLLDLENIVRTHKLHIRGVLHIGAHYGEENQVYDRLQIKSRLFIEPLPTNFQILSQTIRDFPLLNIAIGNENKEIEMHVEIANNSMSSSILKPKLHLLQYPHITFDSKVNVQMRRLDEVAFTRKDYNFINMDIQGYELEALKGSTKTLRYIDFILTEVNREELYENCARIQDITTFLNFFDFELMEISWAGNTWGDAFFIKKSKIKKLRHLLYSTATSLARPPLRSIQALRKLYQR